MEVEWQHAVLVQILVSRKHTHVGLTAHVSQQFLEFRLHCGWRWRTLFASSSQKVQITGANGRQRF